MSCTSQYLHSVLDINLREVIIQYLIKLINDSGVTFDTIAFCGMSGAVIAPTIADRMGKNIIMVRKVNDASHSSYRVEGNVRESKQIIIIDDVMETGDTVTYIYESIVAEKNRLAEIFDVNQFELTGLFLYHENRSDWIKIIVPNNERGNDIETYPKLPCFCLRMDESFAKRYRYDLFYRGHQSCIK